LSIHAARAKSWGVISVFHRLWQHLGIEETIKNLLKGAQVETDISEVLFAMVLNRLYDPYSKLMVTHWIREGASPLLGGSYTGERAYINLN
jgi:hypothetical protein